MSQRRTGFVLDATSMGLTTANGQHHDEEHQTNNRPTLGSVGSNSGDKPSTSTLFTPHSELQLHQLASGRGGGGGTSENNIIRPHAQCNASTETMSTEYYRGRLQRLKESAGSSGDEALMNYELNSIFLKRLDEIDCLDSNSGGDGGNVATQLRLVTFQEWVDLLLLVNNIIFGNMSALEKDAHSKIVACFQSVRGEQQQALEENRKLRKDICAIIKLVQGAYHKNVWNTDDMYLETLTVNQLLGISRDQSRPESESERIAKCMKSLATEVAAKHDEVCHLQTQMSNLEEVVQTARQKLILKDQCIAQLNQQLLEMHDCMTNMANHTTKETINSLTSEPCHPETCSDNAENFDSEADNDKISNRIFENLESQEQQEVRMQRILSKELDDVFELHNQCKSEAVECYKKRLGLIFTQLSTERNDTLRKLEAIRCQLKDLECNIVQTEPATSSSKTSEGAQLVEVEVVRKRLELLNCCNKELQQKCLRLESQHNVLQTKYESECSLNEKNCAVLKDIADLICKLRSTDFSYDHIYTESSMENPFCSAIMQIYERCEVQTNKSEHDDLRACFNTSNGREGLHTTTTTTTKTATNVHNTLNTTTNTTTKL
ncbi:uncharacterized protein LOC115631011 isoform X2 [Scaptodrosophila lebanonensis]|uniref:Uncharacterized protein LOC115631011 isoform X2 n=1 Tax=Drosophila lebanonensis TaxID=7225 RepID=A0A6J2U7F8_DROLE|nr:uncharacterized protein LOC115631011 isoform X2 [Scaptodrosophila lebanonensis]